MKIGILTHHYVTNYGAFMQAYALQEAVKKIAPDAEVQIINYIPFKHFAINTIGWFLWYRNRKNFRHWSNIYSLPFTLHKERKRHMNLTKPCFSAKDINREKFDVIIVGSDEVWNYGDPKSYNGIKFGEGLDCKNLISYAPSAGNSDIENIPDEVIAGLKRFSGLSARDNKTVDLIERATGKTAPLVLDPTLLYPLETKKCRYSLDRDYILFYYCEHLPEHIRKEIEDYAERNNLEILGGGDSDRNYSRCTVNMSPMEWMDMFRNAKYVITGTFHGAVFSIINRKPFKVYLTNKSRISKVSDLLDNFGISNRMITDGFIFNPDSEEVGLDYEKVYKKINQIREKSLNYLRNYLN